MTEQTKELLTRIFTDIQEHQMNNYELARTTKLYNLAVDGLNILNSEKEIEEKNKSLTDYFMIAKLESDLAIERVKYSTTYGYSTDQWYAIKEEIERQLTELKK